jgi:hypothetical protein
MPKGKNATQPPSASVPPTPIQSGGFLDTMLLSIHEINMNPYVLGVAYILLNLGGRFMVLSVSPAQEAFLQNIVFRPLLLFAIMFIGTRNLVVAFWMTIAVLVALHYLFNENSSWYLLRDWTASIKAPPTLTGI